jgi:hypothetical protein
MSQIEVIMNYLPLSKQLNLPWFSGFWMSSLIYKPELKELTVYTKVCGPDEDENFDYGKKYKRDLNDEKKDDVNNNKKNNKYVYYATGFNIYKFIKINENKTQFTCYYSKKKKLLIILK